MSTSAPKRRSFDVAIALGVAAGLLVGAVFLEVHAFRAQEVDCTSLSAMECALARETATELSRLQAASGLALALASAALVLVIRAKLRHDPSSHRPPSG